MAEIEITTCGELMLAGEIVGRITWARPYIEGEVAGAYEATGMWRDEFGDPMCGGCDDCDRDRLRDAEDAVARSLDRIAKCEAEVAQRALGGDLAHHLEQMRRDLEALDF